MIVISTCFANDLGNYGAVYDSIYKETNNHATLLYLRNTIDSN